MEVISLKKSCTRCCKHARKNQCGEPEVSCQVAYMVLIFSQAEKGIKLVQQGQYAEAVALFTEAIKCDPKDYR